MRVVDQEYNASSEPISVTCEDDGKLYEFEVVRHGRWMQEHDDEQYEGTWFCSECKQEYFFAFDEVGNRYCPNCGAKMDGGNET